MLVIYRCAHCEWIDYLDKRVIRCPKCGSPVKAGRLPFIDESITVKVMTTSMKRKDMTVRFTDLEKILMGIVGNNFDNLIQGEIYKERLLFLIKAYVWILLKKHPQLWLDIDHVIRGLVELMYVKIKHGKETTK